MDAPRKTLEVAVLSADDDACMIAPTEMQPNVVTTIVGQDRATGRDRGVENVGISDAPVGQAGLAGCQNIMSEPTQCLDDHEGEVLVGEQTCHVYADSCSAIRRSISS